LEYRGEKLSEGAGEERLQESTGPGSYVYFYETGQRNTMWYNSLFHATFSIV